MLKQELFNSMMLQPEVKDQSCCIWLAASTRGVIQKAHLPSHLGCSAAMVMALAAAAAANSDISKVKANDASCMILAVGGQAREQQLIHHCVNSASSRARTQLQPPTLGQCLLSGLTTPATLQVPARE
jgi:hypothetical protein